MLVIVILNFIEETNLDVINDKASIIDIFYSYAQKEQKEEADKLIEEENLKEKQAKRYIQASLKRGDASERDTELNEILPKISPLSLKYLTKKQIVFQKVSDFVEKFKDVGGFELK